MKFTNLTAKLQGKQNSSQNVPTGKQQIFVEIGKNSFPRLKVINHCLDDRNAAVVNHFRVK